MERNVFRASADLRARSAWRRGAGRLESSSFATSPDLRYCQSFAGKIPRSRFDLVELPIAVIDGPYDATALSRILAKAPISLGAGSCGATPNSACDHGTFIMGLLAARRDALIPGLCPGCQILHIPLFIDEHAPRASIGALANAIMVAVGAGARIINLSLAILGGDSEDDHDLAAALDHAEARGAVVVAAAGNQGRLAMGQLLSHPVAIPVVAVDATGRLLPDCNFGPAISRRGMAAPGQRLGYAPGGGTVMMSGTSVATAVATGILAQVWSECPGANAADIRTALARLTSHDEVVPPMLDRGSLSMALDRTRAVAAASLARSGKTQYASLQGESTMVNGGGQPLSLVGSPDPLARPPQKVTPAHSPSGCACGAPSGVCTCSGYQRENSGFVYAMGTVEAEYPNLAIEREMQVMAHALLPPSWQPDPNMPMKPTEDRSWQYAVLNADRKKTRYIARQLSWRLTIEDFPVFVLKPQDPSDLDGLIDCLNRPKYPKVDGGSGKREGGGKRKASGKKEASGKREGNGSMSLGPPSGPTQDLDVVVGVRGPSTLDGIEVLVDQIFTIAPEQLAPRGLRLFAQLSDNYGLTDADRAYNFLAARYTISPDNLDEIEKFGLVGVPIISSRLSGDTGRVVRAIFTLRGTNIPIEKKYFVRVDVTHEFPIIVNPWQPYLERGEQS